MAGKIVVEDNEVDGVVNYLRIVDWANSLM